MGLWKKVRGEQTGRHPGTVTSKDNKINEKTKMQVGTPICTVRSDNESPEICCFNDAVVKTMALSYFRPRILNSG